MCFPWSANTVVYATLFEFCGILMYPTEAVVDGNVIVVPSVPLSVRLFVTAKVFPLVNVKVPLLVVSVMPLYDVATTAPNV